MRTAFYRFCGAEIGARSLIGDHCFMAGDILNLTIGDDVFINTHCYLQLAGSISVGNAVRIGPFVMILTRSHPIEPDVVRRKSGQDEDYPCRIGRGCWIGVGATILPKVDIAEGCVIAAGAVVAKTTMPNGLYAGVPAVRVKDLPVETPAARHAPS